MGIRLRAKLRLINLFAILFLFSSCENHKNDIEWLFNSIDGDPTYFKDTEINILVSGDYIYLSSEKHQSYGYLFMQRASFNRIHMDVKKAHLEDFDNNICNVKGAVNKKKLNYPSEGTLQNYDNLSPNLYSPNITSTIKKEIPEPGYTKQ